GKAWLGGGAGKVGTREVEFKDDFYLGIYEVTQDEWQRVMQKNLSWASRTGQGKDAVKSISEDELKRFPVENVSWDDCLEFIKRVNAQASETGWEYRLPSEAEWEYACRGGPMKDQAESGFDYYSDQPSTQLLVNQANFKTAKDWKRPREVGSYSPNRLGL